MKLFGASILALFSLFTLSVSAAYSDADHSWPAGLQWQITDDTGLSTHYQRLGIKGTIEDQTVISFVEIVEGEYLDNSILEVFVSQEGQVSVHQLKSGSNRNCHYTGRIRNEPTILNQGFRLKNYTSQVTGSYACESGPKSGECSGIIFW